MTHLTSGLVGAITAGAIFVAAPYVVPSKVEVRTATQKVVRNAWPELAQDRVDALTAALGKIEKRPVTIICANQMWCAALQLDFDNAFESAHWTTSFDTLIFGDVNGITVSDEDLAKTIEQATGLSTTLDSLYRQRLEQLAKAAGTVPERKAQIIIGRNVEK
jgi:hypothetical protein